MRFYELKISGDSVNAPVSANLTYGNYLGGRYDPGALNVNFSVYVAPAAVPLGGSTIRVEGVDPAILTSATTFVGMTATLNGGMMPGLPLATPAHNGMLVSGYIFQAFANWVGTQIDFALVLQGSKYTQDNPGNIVLNWKAGTPLGPALQNTLQTAYPGDAIRMQISPNLILSHDETHPAHTLYGLATLIAEITSTNVQIVKNGNTIFVYDSTYQPKPKKLIFTDFIGQPAWIDKNKIQMKLCLRGDLQVGDVLTMPSQYTSQKIAGLPGLPGLVETFAQSLPSSINYRIAMQGNFRIVAIRHVGNLRQPRGEAWVTVVNAVPLTPDGAPVRATQ